MSTATTTERVVIIRGFCGLGYMWVCAAGDATDQDIIDVCNIGNPSGTLTGWSHVNRKDYSANTGPDQRLHPVTCANDETRRHFRVSC